LIFAQKVHFSENNSVRENFRPKLWPNPLIVEDHDDERALHGRRRAGPGLQHRLAIRVVALLTRPGLQAVESADKAVTTTTREP